MSYIPRMKKGDLRLILAMREPYLSQLLSGEKTVEVRRTRPAEAILRNAKNLRLYLYKGGYIHGYIECYERVEPEVVDVFGDWEYMAKRACLTIEKLKAYLSGCNPDRAIFYCVRNPSRYKVPKPYSTTVQSWMYADAHFIERADKWEVKS